MFPRGGLFLTGPVGCGKSTALFRALEGEGLDVQGFRTPTCRRNGEVLGYAMKSLTRECPVEWRWIARFHGKRLAVYPHTFESMGVRLLRHALEFPPDIFIMDELGFFETSARSFREALRACLEAPFPVLGVLKECSAPLPEEVRRLPNVQILRINRENRDRRVMELKFLLRHLPGLPRSARQEFRSPLRGIRNIRDY